MDVNYVSIIFVIGKFTLPSAVIEFDKDFERL